MRCRLLYLVGWLAPGGLERQLCYLLTAMDRERYRPAVAVWNFSEADVYVPTVRSLTVPLHPLPAGSSSRAKLGAFRRLVRQLRPEVVHSYSFYTNFAAAWGARRGRAIAVGSVRGDFARDTEGSGLLTGRLCARWPRNQIFNSASAAETSRVARSPFTPRRCFVVRNGIDLEHFRQASFADASHRIVGVGSLVPIKRWDRLLRTAVALKCQGVGFSIQISGDGVMRAQLEQQARELAISDCVSFPGFTRGIPALLAESRFLVHTSDSEGCPNVIMEAMACGRAVVATDAGDTSFLVEDGITGFVVPRGDDAALLARMRTLLTDANLCRRMGEAGRARAERLFGLERLAAETLAAYRAMGWEDS